MHIYNFLYQLYNVLYVERDVNNNFDLLKCIYKNIIIVNKY